MNKIALPKFLPTQRMKQLLKSPQLEVKMDQDTYESVSDALEVLRDDSTKTRGLVKSTMTLVADSQDLQERADGLWRKEATIAGAIMAGGAALAVFAGPLLGGLSILGVGLGLVSRASAYKEIGELQTAAKDGQTRVLRRTYEQTWVSHSDGTYCTTTKAEAGQWLISPTSENETEYRVRNLLDGEWWWDDNLVNKTPGSTKSWSKVQQEIVDKKRAKLAPKKSGSRATYRPSQKGSSEPQRFDADWKSSDVQNPFISHWREPFTNHWRDNSRDEF